MAPRKLDPQEARKEAFRSYQNRRQSDGFQDEVVETKAQAWKSFVGEHGQRLRAFLLGFGVVNNPRFPPYSPSSLPLVRELLEQLGYALPDLPPPRLCEWLISHNGGRPLGWQELTPGLAQIVANDGGPALVVGAGPEADQLVAIICPDEAASASNPTVVMVAEGFVLAPGTVLQGFRGAPCRYFGLSVAPTS
jgi:hypothetical protein